MEIGIAVAEECRQQRQGKRAQFAQQRQLPACYLPERSLRKLVSPEDLPASDGPGVHVVDQPAQLVNPPRCRPLPHGGDQDNHRRKVHLAAEKKKALPHLSVGQWDD